MVLKPQNYRWLGVGAADFDVTAQAGQVAITRRCIIDEHGRVFLETALGFDLGHTQDMLQALDAIELVG